MSQATGNGFADMPQGALLAQRLQADTGTLKARARDPHADLKTKIHRACIARLGAAFLNFDVSQDLTARVRDRIIEPARGIVALTARVREIVNEQLTA